MTNTLLHINRHSYRRSNARKYFRRLTTSDSQADNNNYYLLTFLT